MNDGKEHFLCRFIPLIIEELKNKLPEHGTLEKMLNSSMLIINRFCNHLIKGKKSVEDKSKE